MTHVTTFTVIMIRPTFRLKVILVNRERKVNSVVLFFIIRHLTEKSPGLLTEAG